MTNLDYLFSILMALAWCVIIGASVYGLVLTAFAIRFVWKVWRRFK
jgi:hypothetical protein